MRGGLIVFLLVFLPICFLVGAIANMGGQALEINQAQGQARERASMQTIQSQAAALEAAAQADIEQARAMRTMADTIQQTVAGLLSATADARQAYREALYIVGFIAGFVIAFLVWTIVKLIRGNTHGQQAK